MTLVKSTLIPSASSVEALTVTNSLKLEGANAERLKSNNTHAATTPTNAKKGTFSFWVKRTKLGASYMVVSASSARYSRMFFNSSDQIQLYSGDSSWNSVQPITNAVFRDTNAWYHIVLILDSTDATAANRLKLYVNNVQQTWATAPNITQDGDLTLTGFGGPTWHSWGSNLSYYTPSAYFCGYLAEVNYVDGATKDATDFGMYDEDTGIWQPILYSGSRGNCGYYLDFKDSSNLGDDEGGNSFDFDESNIAAIDQATDTPSNTFCTINTLVDQSFAAWDLTEGGTKGPNVAANCGVVGSIALTSGKWYWEGVTTSFSGTNYWQWGVVPVDSKQGNSADALGDAGTAWYSGDNAFYTSTSASGQSAAYDSGFTGYTAGDIWSVSLNCDVSPYQMTFRINNAVPGTASNNTDRSVGTYTSARAVVPFVRLANSASDNTWHNFGNPFIAALSGGNADGNGHGDFCYSPPSGYLAICSQNLASTGG